MLQFSIVVLANSHDVIYPIDAVIASRLVALACIGVLNILMLCVGQEHARACNAYTFNAKKWSPV
jgi:hypothetical protein